MSKQCSVNKCLVVLLFVIFGIYRELTCCNGTILSKGKITMCVKDKNSDPFNVVEGKGCEKKLVITKSVSAEQVGTHVYRTGVYQRYGQQPYKAAFRLGARHWCPSLVLAPSLNMIFPNEIGHSAQERASLVEVVLNNGTVLNMFCEQF